MHKVHCSAEIRNPATGETMTVHEVGDQLLALDKKTTTQIENAVSPYLRDFNARGK